MGCKCSTVYTVLVTASLERHIEPAQCYFDQHEAVSGAVIAYFRYKALALMRDPKLENDIPVCREWARTKMRAIPFDWLCHCDLVAVRRELGI